MNRVRWLVIAFALIAAVRLIVAWQLPITDDEAYYWMWSRHLQWGYPANRSASRFTACSQMSAGFRPSPSPSETGTSAGLRSTAD